jgi:hypothetical protein
MKPKKGGKKVGRENREKENGWHPSIKQNILSKNYLNLQLTVFK